MMEWTDRHCRYFLRLITRRTLLYTEMITTGALLHGQPERLLAFDPAEQPLALQLGGSEPRLDCLGVVSAWNVASGDWERGDGPSVSSRRFEQRTPRERGSTSPNLVG